MRRALWCFALVALTLRAVSVAGAPARAGAAARVKPYTVSASLKEVGNAKQFRGTAAQKALLARNLFVVTPTDAEQLFFIYENNDYANIPSFVTTDLVLQLYHVFFDFTLRRVETEKLSPLLRRLTEGMFLQSVSAWKSLSDPKLKDAARHNVAYFGVAARLLGLEVAIPAEAQPLVEADLALIEKHEGFDLGGVFPYKIDYSQFVPRGHYTRTETLRRFFGAMMWYGLSPFSFYKQVNLSPAPAVRSDETVRMAILMARALHQMRLEATWDRIYEPTAFYVGFSDDLTPGEYRALMNEVFGKDAPVAAYTDPAKFDAFIARGKALRLPAIQPKVRLTEYLLPFPDPRTCQLRLMGQRHVPDSEMLQRLSTPLERYFPAGMDVMAVLGSPRARWLLDTGFPELFDTRAWKGYRPERAKLEAEFAKVSEKEWTRNLYRGWLWALQSLVRPAAEGYPSFMRSVAWEDKSLNTALASWAELRHDTILYAKQSISVECGGDGEEPPKPKGYVEPNVAFYQRMQRLTRLSREGLEQRSLLDRTLKEKFEDLEDLLVFLGRVSEKELRNEALTPEEYEQIRIIGASVERLTLSVIEGQASNWYEITSPVDRDMAVVADVHTGGMNPIQVLEEGVGHANEILVIVPVEGKLQLTRGAAFSYYEFQHPLDDRLTDEKWQAMLKSEKPPRPPAWTKSFMPPDAKPQAGDGSGSMDVISYSSGC
ncbi:MAG: DUF3160 domain-containing protein [Armatimonadetes bacterium]|nr:DUF3160 domain-containing protein [Armatimonadota bacterium]